MKRFKMGGEKYKDKDFDFAYGGWNGYKIE